MSAAAPQPPTVPGRAEVLAILAAFGDRPPEEVPESVDSMELAWLVHQIESRYGGTVPDSSLVRMTTVTAVLDELAALAALPGAAAQPDAAEGADGTGTGPDVRAAAPSGQGGAAAGPAGAAGGGPGSVGAGGPGAGGGGARG
ncbi:hypothetical protein [Streptomyces sp. NPDC020983]|uniref:hypothetical protein n=1 Tax=Streptomyces sp. NPDC020983 TaxID=3365106 RepID=UPI0037A792C1